MQKPADACAMCIVHAKMQKPIHSRCKCALKSMKQKYSTSACVQRLSPTETTDRYRISLFWSVKVFDCLTGDSRTWLLGSTWLSCFFIKEAEQLLPQDQNREIVTLLTRDSGDSTDRSNSSMVTCTDWQYNTMQCKWQCNVISTYETPQKNTEF